MELIGKSIIHDKFGKGKIQSVDGNYIIVLFISNGLKRKFVYPGIFNFARLSDPELDLKLREYIDKHKPVIEDKSGNYSEIPEDGSPYDVKMMRFKIRVIEEKLDSERMRREITTYQDIMNRFYNTDVSQDKEFQRKYNGFYKIRSKTSFYEPYYKYMQDHKKNKNISFIEALQYFYKESGRLEASFISKLLHTLNPALPIWDKYVLEHLGIKASNSSVCMEERYRVSNNIYSSLTNWFENVLYSEDGKAVIEMFDTVFKNNGLTDTKKIDFVLWGIR
ncbi:MAG: hypothetical protein K0S41_244 [Anaerocolumna sp.]|jgi:hypothetical protein|nr:hypothetical protein [Anaerocolumna sp.]